LPHASERENERTNERENERTGEGERERERERGRGRGRGRYGCELGRRAARAFYGQKLTVVESAESLPNIVPTDLSF
jgi:hypothetical protein